MDVVCGRCRAEYEFDDALISERGTTVRCTNCGLQFKVFPPMGQRAPEIWRLFEPGRLGTPYAEYASLGRLQKAIARGEVSPFHLLARGSEPPRALQEIVELQPLLHQPKSERPPPVAPHSMSDELGEGESLADDSSARETKSHTLAPAGQKTGSGTVLGFEMRPDPADVPDGTAPPSSSPTELDDPFASDEETSFTDDEEQVVPASTRPSDFDHDAVVPASPLSSGRKTPESKPKIVSALSLSSGLTPPPSETEEAPTSISPRTPLRSALQTSQAPAPRPQSDQAPNSYRSSYPSPDDPRAEETQIPSSRPRRTTPRDSEHEVLEVMESELESGAKHDPALPPRFEEPAPDTTEPSELDHFPPQEPASKPGVQDAPASSAIKISAPPLPEKRRPTKSDADLAAARASVRAPTPTPLGLRAYERPEAQSSKAKADVPAAQRARSAWIVLAVVVSSVAFIALSNRSKLDPGSSAQGAATPESIASEEKADAQRALRAAEIAWLKELFESTEVSAPKQSVATNWDDVGLSDSWEKVDALRIEGKLDEARVLSRSMNLEEGAYSLAMLDIADAPEAPPWPLIEKRLREAATGEKLPFLARSALIYVLLASEQGAAAVAEFESWKRISGATEAPLFDSLQRLIVEYEEEHRQNAALTQAQTAEHADESEELGDPELGDPELGDSQQEERQEQDSQRDEPPEAAHSTQPTPRPNSPAPAAQPKPQKKSVPPGIKDKVTQADNLWRTGNREAALKLYRQVVAEIGTSHFLGVRANSRIRQAEREKAAAQ